MLLRWAKTCTIGPYKEIYYFVRPLLGSKVEILRLDRIVLFNEFVWQLWVEQNR